MSCVAWFVLYFRASGGRFSRASRAGVPQELGSPCRALRVPLQCADVPRDRKHRRCSRLVCVHEHDVPDELSRRSVRCWVLRQSVTHALLTPACQCGTSIPNTSRPSRMRLPRHGVFDCGVVLLCCNVCCRWAKSQRGATVRQNQEECEKW